MQYILRKTKSKAPYKWDLLDETGSQTIEHVMEDEDQWPTKEWGEYGWYWHPTKEDVSKASKGEMVWLSQVVMC